MAPAVGMALEVLRPWGGECGAANSGQVSWFLHAVELPGGSWACYWSRREYGIHPTLDLAVDHLRSIAADLGPSELFAHHLDGSVRRLGSP